MTGYMTSDIHRHRQARNVRRRPLDVHRKRRCVAAEALRPHAELIDRFEHFLFQSGIIGIGIALRHRAAESLLRQKRALLKIAPDSNAEHHRRARISSED